MTLKQRTYKIYKVDINDALCLLAGELAASGYAPVLISYQGVEDGHTVWLVEYYDAD